MSWRSLIACLAALVLVGCAAPKHNYMPVTTDISEPPLGVVVERQVGDEMVHQGRYREHDALHVLSQLKPVWAYTVMPGYFLKTGSDEQGDFYRIGGAGDDSGYVQKAALADPFTALMVKTDNSLCVITVLNVAACGNVPGGFEKVKKPVTSADSLQRTLIYNGRVGDKVNIGYREFSGNTARPAFNNNVEYDLNESREIAYRGARLQILDATNRSIKFRVISNFNQANR
ncbi:MAG: hypothetical protein U1E12_22225 [Hydrogenophaga sp.]|uniref:hypothetical protein n=1 Tax=Hydrogenophaga sp. TaxID=1904254 RepID=UPI002ABAC702|nr:hypothetical protein [Hydrogenophaga sp.]MDZ4104389.1 hypothetical protein [Hydrogenophaga sp.]